VRLYSEAAAYYNAHPGKTFRRNKENASQIS
jgi:hypothetical protein